MVTRFITVCSILITLVSLVACGSSSTSQNAAVVTVSAGIAETSGPTSVTGTGRTPCRDETFSADTGPNACSMHGGRASPTPVATAIPPTATPRPTNTPYPTFTPQPTLLPTRTPEPEPVVIEGKGKKVTDEVTMPSFANRVVLTHKGKSNFIVKAYLGDVEAGLVNVIGSYSGSRPIISEGKVRFEVNADGPWTIRIEPLGIEATADKLISGKGDYASGFFNAAKGNTPYHYSHEGKSNFIVEIHCVGKDDMVTNEIGSTDGEAMVSFGESPCYWDIQADGAWEIKPK